MKHLTHIGQYVLMLSLSFFFFSCEKEIKRPNSDFQFTTIVVESILTNEYINQKIILSKPNNTQNQANQAISDAVVSVSNDSQTFVFLESDTMKGVYFSTEKFATGIDKIYFLNITVNGENYEASTNIEAVSNYNPIDIEAESDSTFFLSTPSYSYNPSEQAMYELSISWDTDSLVNIKTYRYQLNSLDVGIVFSPDEESIIFPSGTLIIGKKYSLTDDYADYIRALLAETHWQGGLFDDEKANLPSNISNGGLGYFTACSVVVDTLIVE